MNLKSSISKILTNKKTLHIVFVLSLLNLIGYLVCGNIKHPVGIPWVPEYVKVSLVLIVNIPLYTIIV